ncbi:FAD-dependent oxidoreductase [Caldinitratiruptor microaerophilus]|uniref:FAD-dependent oxidoreductase n=1 Tax=Caldinitratiruptor microaerophilus TaxID=671077 RepID=A0AA35G6T3_9FIRM|nr:FAD-dependent oxidoreductase [Caldinitratiruptor microaerophilus]BDG59030.1 FAD-dependent oxidoreductase [Caldinitratiruptor microaerophilus]
MARVVVVGGGWAGCAAALAAAKAGAEAVLVEKTDMLLGTGLVGGIMRNNGRFTATEEMIAMGAGELFEATDRVATHRGIDFPDHRHATLYNVTRIEPEVRAVLRKAGVDVRLRTRITAVRMEGERILAVASRGGPPITGDVFIDTTGSAGPPGNCTRYGEGCVMCVLRCPTFGGRVGLAALCGVRELQAVNAAGKVGAYSGSCKLAKDSLAPEIVAELEEKGVVVVPIPDRLQDTTKLALKACQQYATEAYGENLILLDTGHAKLMAPYMDLEKLRAVPGFEEARYIDPYAGGVANSVRFLAIAPHDVALRVEGVANLYCAGEKAGPLVGHTEAICTGTLAGHNAARQAFGLEPVTIPETLAVGDAIAYVTRRLEESGGLGKKYTFSGSVYFERMRRLGLYTTDVDAVRRRVEAAGMTGFFARPVARAQAHAG